MRSNTAIILLNYNGWHDTVECMESLSSLGDQNYSLFIVDNLSTDRSHSKLYDFIDNNYKRLGYRDFYSNGTLVSGNADNNRDRTVYLIQSGQNGGFAYGNNIGIKTAKECKKFDYYWMLNSDTTIDSDALQPMIDEFHKDQKIGIVGSLLIYMDTKQVIQAVGGVKFYKYLARGDQLGGGEHRSQAAAFKAHTNELSYISGASMLVSKAFLDDVGLMTESYFLYFEELDWAFRAKKKGYKLSVAIDSNVYHKEGASIGTSTRSARSLQSEYYLSRNLIVCFKRFIPLFVPFAIARNFINCIKLLRTQEYLRVKTIIFATIDGMLGRNNKSGRDFNKFG